MGSGVQRGQSLQHTEQAVGGRKLQVFLWDVADLSTAVSGLETRKCNSIGGKSKSNIVKTDPKKKLVQLKMLKSAATNSTYNIRSYV